MTPRAHRHPLDGKFHTDCPECELILSALPREEAARKVLRALDEYQAIAERTAD